MSWLRAAASAVVIVGIGFVGAIVLPNLVLTSATSLSRDTRMLVASAVSIGVVILMAFILRKLQARGLI